MEELLSYFKPENYRISLQIYKQTGKLRGTVVITGEQLAETVKLHAVDLTADAVVVNGEGVEFFQEFGLLTFTPREIAKKCEIEVKFHGDLNRNMEGAYISTYQYKAKGEKEPHEERIVATQFESHYARGCFPCIDEPAAKATFDLKLITPDVEDTVISNMPAKESRIVEHPAVEADLTLSKNKTVQKKIVTFERTPKMSTYLLAFVMGRFHAKTVETLGGVKVTTYCALNQSPEMLMFANQTAAAALNYYNGRFGVEYPLPKLDQVALPDFEAGAMENWGLVTYRESCLLADENSPQESKESIAITITHELSHQWFGNLVTMKWWDDLWLNESFATVMSYVCTDEIYPDYKIWDDFFTGECLAALTRDAYPGVQAVRQPVKDPSEIATLFDASIVYAKGAHLMFMLMRLMGKRQFFAGIKKYFKKYKYGNTTGDDLWECLTPYAKFDVREFMDAWISQPGYPVITDGVQQRFLITGGADETKWPLPEVRDDMSGHYLLNLSGEEFNAALAEFGKLTTEQRYRLLIDRLLLCETSLVSAASLLDLLLEFKQEQNKSVWDLLVTMVNKLKVFAPYGSEEYEMYRKFVYAVAEPVLKRLTVRPKLTDKDNETKLRPRILALALYAKDERTLKELAKRYSRDYAKLDAETRYAVLAAKLETAEEKVFDKYVEDYAAATDPDLKADLLAAFCDVEREENVEKALALLEQPEIVRPQDHVYLFAYLARNHATKQRALAWLYSHWDYIKEMTGEKTLDDYARIAARVIRTQEEADAYFEFFDRLANLPAFTRTVAVAHQEINARLHWIKLDQKDVTARLKAYSPSILGLK